MNPTEIENALQAIESEVAKIRESIGNKAAAGGTPDDMAKMAQAPQAGGVGGKNSVDNFLG